MNEKMILIISDKDNQPFWNALSPAAIKRAGSVRIILDQDLSHQRLEGQYDVIIMDISNIEDLHRLIQTIHQEQPSSRIIIITSTPTWKFAREVLRRGAADLIRKYSHPDETLEELSSLQVCLS